MKFWKVSAIGNDFVLVHGEDTAGMDLPELTRRVCDRRFGVGSDGLLVLEGRVLRMFNPDGSEDFCGNGLRCAAVHAFERGWIDEADSMIHDGREIRTWVFPPDSARVELGSASFDPADVPLNQAGELWQQPIEILGEQVVASSLSTGSTHTVIFVDEMPRDDWFLAASSALETHPLFPERTSTMWVQVLGPHSLRMRPFERGAGETRGCGTGSAAAAVAYSRAHGVTGKIEVHNTGGMVTVHLEDWHGPIMLESATVTHFEGVIEPSLYAQAR